MPFAPELCVVLLIRVVRNLWGRAAPVELQGQSQPSGISGAPPRAASPHRPVKSKCCRWQANAILQLVLCHGHVAIVTDAHRCDLPGAVGTAGRGQGGKLSRSWLSRSLRSRRALHSLRFAHLRYPFNPVCRSRF